MEFFVGGGYVLGGSFVVSVCCFDGLEDLLVFWWEFLVGFLIGVIGFEAEEDLD